MFLDRLKSFKYNSNVLHSLVVDIAEYELSKLSSNDLFIIKSFLSLMSLNNSNAIDLDKDFITLNNNILNTISDNDLVHKCKLVASNYILTFTQIGLSNQQHQPIENNQVNTLIFKLKEINSNWGSVETFINNLVFITENDYGVVEFVNNIKMHSDDILRIEANFLKIEKSTANIIKELLVLGRLKAGELLLRSYEKFCNALSNIYDNAELNNHIIEIYNMVDKSIPKKNKNTHVLSHKISHPVSLCDGVYHCDNSLGFTLNEMIKRGWLNVEDYSDYKTNVSIKTNTGLPKIKESRDVKLKFEVLKRKINDMYMFSNSLMEYKLANFEASLAMTLKIKGYSKATLGEIDGITTSFVRSIDNFMDDENIAQIIRQICEVKREISKIIYSTEFSQINNSLRSH